MPPLCIPGPTPLGPEVIPSVPAWTLQLRLFRLPVQGPVGLLAAGCKLVALNQILCVLVAEGFPFFCSSLLGIYSPVGGFYPWYPCICGGAGSLFALCQDWTQPLASLYRLSGTTLCPPDSSRWWFLCLKDAFCYFLPVGLFLS